MTAQKIHVRGQLFYTIMRRGEERERRKERKSLFCVPSSRKEEKSRERETKKLALLTVESHKNLTSFTFP
jgi:hypothetical protein